MPSGDQPRPDASPPGQPGPVGARLDALFFSQARRHPDRLALVDDPQRRRWNAKPPLRMTWRDAARGVEAIAGSLQRAGFKRGSVVAMRAPNTVETVLFMLAVWRAGLVVLTIPPLWGKHECLGQLPDLRPVALVTAGVDDGQPVGRLMGEVANGLLTVRQVFYVGGDLPAFAHDVSEMIRSTSPGPGSVETNGVPATIHIAEPTAEGRPTLLVRGHDHWLATGLMAMSGTGRREGDAAVVPYAVGGVIGLGAGIVPWLLTAGTLHLHRFLSFQGLVDHMLGVAPEASLLPGGFVAAALARIAKGGGRTSVVTAVWRDCYPASEAPESPAGGATIVDLTSLDDLALLIERRQGSAPPRSVPVGRVRGGDGPDLLAIRVDGGPNRAGDPNRSLIGGRIAVAGPMVPKAKELALGDGTVVATGLPVGDDGFVRTGLACRLVDGQPPRATVTGPDRSHAVMYGLPVGVAALDPLYASYAGASDAAAVSLADASGVRRLAAAIVARPGQNVTYADFRRFLEDRSVAPHHIPAGIRTVEMIPRGADGGVMRDILEERLAREA